MLDKLGREFVHYRSWGRGGKVLGQESERNFPEDHHLSKSQHVAIRHPRRVAFGLPHNYGPDNNKQVQPANNDLDRRASPLFLHIHQVGEDAQAFGVATFLPSRFLPDGEELRSFGKMVPLQPHAELWKPIHGYLDRLIGKAGATEKQSDLKGEEINLG
jgi:CRISPR-associated protein Cmr1